MRSSLVKSSYLIERKNKMGYMEQIKYEGSIANKPKGWRIVKKLS